MNGVTFAKAINVGRCAECSVRFAVDAPIAHYTETGLHGMPPRNMRLRRRYCEPCGRLLEDSLTTTDAPEATKCLA